MPADRPITRRPPAAGDRDAVVAVIAARDLADLGEIDSQPEDLDGDWRRPGFEPARDARVAELAGTGVVGYAALRPEGSRVTVHPAHDDAPIFPLLLRWVEERERELGRPLHRQAVAGTDARGSDTLREHGYEHVRSVFRMQRSLRELPARADPPPGVWLRALDPVADAVAVHALDAVAFAGAADYAPESLEAFRSEHLEAHDLDLEVSRVACQGDGAGDGDGDGRIVGFLVARRWRRQDTGFVDLLAVDPAAHGRGIGSALLAAALTGFAAAGLREARLGVDSENPRALRLYERHGMTPRHRFDVYERPASAPATRRMPRSASDSTSA